MPLRPLLLLALAACRPAIPPDPVPPPAVALSAGTVRYTLTDHRRIQQTVHGQTIVTEVAARFLFEVSLTGTDSGLAAQVLVESATVEGDVGGMGAAGAADGARITGHLGSRGSGFRRSDGEAPHELLDQLTLNLHDLLPALPPGGVLAETTWTDTTAVRGRAAGLPVTVTSRATSRAEAWVPTDGGHVLPLRRSVAYTLEGQGDPTGTWIVLRGQGASHIRHLLDPAGAVVLAVGVDTLRADIELGGAGLLIPVVQTRTDTLRRVTP